MEDTRKRSREDEDGGDVNDGAASFGETLLSLSNQAKRSARVTRILSCDDYRDNKAQDQIKSVMAAWKKGMKEAAKKGMSSVKYRVIQCTNTDGKVYGSLFSLLYKDTPYVDSDLLTCKSDCSIAIPCDNAELIMKALESILVIEGVSVRCIHTKTIPDAKEHWYTLGTLVWNEAEYDRDESEYRRRFGTRNYC